MTRVLFVNHSSAIGGAETNLLNILRYSEHGGFKPVGVLLPGHGPFEREICDLGVPIGIVHYHSLRWGRPWRYMQTLYDLCLGVYKTRPDVIHLNHDYLVDYAYQLGRLTRKPVLCHVRNLEPPSFIGHNIQNYCGMSRIVAISNLVSNHLLNNGIPKRLLVQVYDGIDTAKFSQANDSHKLRQAWKTANFKHVVGYIGRLVEWKGLEDLVQAAHHVLSKRPETLFMIAGEDEQNGRYREHLETLVHQSGISDNFRFLGFQRDISDILVTLDVLVLPSHQEPLGNVVLEAMAVGRVVVATNDGGAAEVISDGVNGILVPPRKPAELAKSIISALNMSPTKYQCIADSALQTIHSGFTIQLQVERLSHIYRELLKNRTVYK